MMSSFLFIFYFSYLWVTIYYLSLGPLWPVGQILSTVSFVCLRAKNGFNIFKWVEKNERIIFYDIWIIWNSNFRNTALPICIHGSLCYNSKVVQYYMAHKTWNIYYLAHYRKWLLTFVLDILFWLFTKISTGFSKDSISPLLVFPYKSNCSKYLSIKISFPSKFLESCVYSEWLLLILSISSLGSQALSPSSLSPWGL